MQIVFGNNSIQAVLEREKMNASNCKRAGRQMSGWIHCMPPFRNLVLRSGKGNDNKSHCIVNVYLDFEKL